MSGPTPDEQVENETVRIARQLAAHKGKRATSGVFKMSPVADRLIASAMANPAFKTRLFRLVDVYPALLDDADVLRHVDEYLGSSASGVPKLMGASVAVAEHLPLGGKVTAKVARAQITRMAEQFIAGSSGAEALDELKDGWKAGRGFVADLLGEKTVTGAEADRYAAKVDELIHTLVPAAARWRSRKELEADDLGPLPRVAVSVKPTALSAKYAPLTAEDGLDEAKARLRPILRTAIDLGAVVWFDMEHGDVKDLTLRLCRDLLDEPEHAELDAGIAVQAYLRDSHDDLTELVRWAGASGRAAAGHPLHVRLVKGAYWDAETIQAEAAGWVPPVFADKRDTDANYERCTRLLHDAHGTVRAAFASHNVRSLAHAVASARARGIPDHGYEIQLLHGMAEPLQAAVADLGIRLRIYTPVGELLPGMAYLVRRLLENTSNDGFVRRSYVEGAAIDTLVAPPVPTGPDGTIPGPPPVAVRPTTSDRKPGPYRPEPTAEWRRRLVRLGFADALTTVRSRGGAQGMWLGGTVDGLIGDEWVRTAATIDSVDPAEPSTLVARSTACGKAEADAAVAAAVGAWPAWASRPAAERAGVLFAAAAWMRERRGLLGALEVIEAGKPWAEADADVCEAIDFCEYYGREALRLDAGGGVQSPPGERNDLRYQGKGVGAVIAPWNFPLAIPCGMVAAALVAGNAVVLKPAEQTPAIARKLVEAFVAAGVPAGVLGFLPGQGEEVGAALVEHPDIAFVCFTGSREVGLTINASAAIHRKGQRHIKRVVAELGGKNAVVVDADADLDAAVPAIVHSAFGFAGQKCSALSRLVVLDAVHDELVARLQGAAGELRLGHPSDPRVTLGPVIDEDAVARCVEYAGVAAADGRVVSGGMGSTVPTTGWFVPATIVTDLAPGSAVLRDEIFGPILAVQRAVSFDHAIELANDTEFALTAGVLSRSPRNIEQAAAELRAGNVYVNRGITGAVPGRQPFGGYGMSGVGSKAGGPDYLLQFMDPRVVTENTVRQGFSE